MNAKTSLATLCTLALFCVAGCGGMTGRSDASGTSAAGASGSSLEGNGSRSGGQDAASRQPQGTQQDMQQDRQQDTRQVPRKDLSRDQDTGGNSAMNGSVDGSGQAGLPTDLKAGSHPSWRATVQAIETLSRQEAGTSIGLGGVGAAAVGGNVAGMGTAGNSVYRVTLRAEDGSSHNVIVENPPDYKPGDRVTYANGMIRK